MSTIYSHFSTSCWILFFSNEIFIGHRTYYVTWTTFSDKLCMRCCCYDNTHFLDFAFCRPERISIRSRIIRKIDLGLQKKYTNAFVLDSCIYLVILFFLFAFGNFMLFFFLLTHFCLFVFFVLLYYNTFLGKKYLIWTRIIEAFRSKVD